jgi:hypothetical protein
VTENKGSARKGRAIESLVAASCILATGGELNALTALVDDEGVDITFKRRDGNRTLDVQVKSRFYDGSKALRKKGRFIADIRKATFRPRKDLFILYVAVDSIDVDMGPVWLVPSKVLEKQGIKIHPKKTGKQLRFDASVKPTSKDKWTPYRMSKAQFPQAILKAITDLESESST